jgi:hypothetical protein
MWWTPLIDLFSVPVPRLCTLCHLDQQRIFRAVAYFFEHAFCKQKDRQCMYNVTPRRVRASIVAMEKQSLLYVP